MRILRLGLIPLFLLTLPGCSMKPVTLTKTETVLFAPPAALLADCPETMIQVKNNADLLELAKLLRIDLAECNLSKARLREWLQEEQTAQKGVKEVKQ